MISISFDPKPLERSLKQLGKEHGLAVRDLMNDQMRLWCLDVARIMPPKNKKQGRQRIAKDLNQLFVPARDVTALRVLRNDYGPRLEHRVGVGNHAAMFDILAPDATLSEMHRHHEAMRDKRGRVIKAARFTHDLGKIKFANKMYVNPRRLKQFKKALVARVGLLKAGWLDAADHFAKLSHAKDKMPRWVRKAGAGATGIGSHAGRMSASGNGRIVSVNSVKYVGRHASTSLFRSAQARRERDVMKHLKKRLEGKNGLIERFNKGKV